MSDTIHIVSFSVPWPPDYGGAMDVYYKIRALHQIGVKVILHCFMYNRTKSDELLKYCQNVYYYPRKLGFVNQFSTTPFIVKSRESHSMLKRLAADSHPVLFEGLHTTLYLGHPSLAHKQQWVRAHNIEHEYYHSLGRAESWNHRKLFYRVEAWRLKRFSAHLKKAKGVFAISLGDEAILKSDNLNTYLIPAFHGCGEVIAKPGKGEYLLYHGDLSIPENYRSVVFLMEVCENLPYELVIAGKNPSQKLKRLIEFESNVTLVENPDANKMQGLVLNAGTILLPARQTTGLRLKLLVSLFLGRHCLASPQMVENTGLESLCNIAGNKEDWQMTIMRTMSIAFSDQNLKQRKDALAPFLDEANALKIRKILFGHKN
jgi:hypothetical protein